MSAKRPSSLIRFTPIVRFTFGAAILLGALVAHVPLAHAATTWNITPSSACTLFDAITANDTGTTSGSCAAGDSGAGTINLAAGTYTLGASLPLINHALSIVGSGVGSTIIDGQNQYYVFRDQTSVLSGVSDLTIERAGAGGGVGQAITAGGNPTINNVVVKDSTADGGISVSGNTASITNTAIINNAGNAFAIRVGVTNGTITINNVTMYGNEHGIYVDANGTGTVNITNVTSASNIGAGIDFHVGGGSPTVNFKNSILANSTNCIEDAVTSQGHNITSDNSCGFVGTSNHNNTDPALGSLTLASSTYVLPIDYNSPAYDSGDSTGAPSTDQRGVTRPQCSGVDIGAYETTTCTPAPPSGGGSGGSTTSGGSGGSTSGSTKKTTTTTSDTPTTPPDAAAAVTDTPKASSSSSKKSSPKTVAVDTAAAKKTSKTGLVVAGVGIVMLLGFAGFWVMTHPALRKKLHL